MACSKQCIDCGSTVSTNLSKRCALCNRATWVDKSKHPNWRGGSATPSCRLCHKKITHMAKLCRSCKDKTIPAWNKGKPGLSGKAHPMWKGGRPLCKDCKVEIWYYFTRCGSCSRKHNSGSRHYNWHGGISRFPYPFKFNEQLKSEIRERDRYICKICGMTQAQHLYKYGSRLPIHHIDYNKSNLNSSNLLTVCLRCNIQA